MIKRITAIQETLAMVFFAVVVFLICLQVLSRYVVGAGLSWLEESTLFFYLWALFLAIPAGLTRGTDIRVTILYDILSEKNQRYLNILCYALWIVFATVMTYEAFKFVHILGARNGRTPSIGVPWVAYYAGVFVAYACSVLQAVARMLETLTGKGEKQV